ncbi:DUF1801 domain-containing protein [bacterium]|nr:DUF1801 domain-containing protein [bacterium]
MGKIEQNQPASREAVAKRIEQLIADTGGWRGELIAEIRRIVHEVDPEVVEDWKWKGTPVWSHEGMYVHANPFKNKVKITFLHGAQLEDRENLFNAGLDGNKWRAIDLFEDDHLDSASFKRLLGEAIEYNSRNNVAKSKGSNL